MTSIDRGRPSGARSRLALALLATACAAACGGGGNRADQTTGTNAAALTPPPSVPDLTFDLTFPVGYGINTAAIGAAEDVTLGPSVQIIATDGSQGTVTNTGAGTMTVGPKTIGGNFVSVGDITAGPSLTAKSVTSSGTVSLGPHSNVGTVTNHATLAPLVHRTVIVHPPPGTAADINVGPDQTLTLAPGLYRNVTIGPRAVVDLSAGTYLVDNFSLGPNAQLQLNTSGGNINLYANDSATWSGTTVGDGKRFVLGLVGSGALTLQSGFTGTALAPAGSITLRPSSTPYQGTFYGKHVVVGPGVTVHEIATPFLLDSLTIAKTTLCVGEETEVTATSTDPTIVASTWIQEVAGNHQFIQFGNAPGSRTVFATVLTPDGRSDFTSSPVMIQPCAPTSSPPIAVHFWGARDQQNAVQFMVRGYDANGHETLLGNPSTYSWDFGDGQTQTTASPLTTHDYTASMRPLDEHTFFKVTVVATSPAGVSTAVKIVPVWSLYARNRAKGIIQPPATVSAVGAQFGVTLTNYEPTPITINAARVDLMPCDPALPVAPQTAQSLSVTIPASSTTTINVPTPSQRGRDTCSVAIHLFGTSPAGVVYADTYRRLQENPLIRRQVNDPATIALLNQASALTADPTQFSGSELLQLVMQGELPNMPPSLPPGSTYSSPGDECTPGDTDPINGLVCLPTPDWVMNPPEILNAFKGDIFMDRGCGKIGQLLDAIHQHFSHDLLFVNNHSEIRHSTANEDRESDIAAIVKDTAKLDADKLRYGFPGTEGTKTHSIDEITNYYCVPDPNGDGGDETERGCKSIGGQPIVAGCECPEGTWRMAGESSPDPVRCADDYTAVPSIVVRPPPANPEKYALLSNVVDKGLSINSHYRFYMYSHADTPVTPGPEGGWANGTLSTVCSSFAQQSALMANVSMNPTVSGPLHFPDGLFSYDIQTRTNAGYAQYSIISNSAKDSCSVTPDGGAIVGGAIGALGGPIGTTIGAGVGIGISAGDYCRVLADNVANQICNCFGNDECDNGSDTWKTVSAGVAVSPQDITNWDLPSNGGTWGYNEAAFYAEVSFRHKYTWQKSAGSGAIDVTVVDASGNLVPGATILLDDEVVGASSTAKGGDTAPLGTLHLDARPAGSHYIAAQLDECSSVVTGLPPMPPAPSAATIPSLPSCSSISATTASTVTACTYQMHGDSGCPAGGWIDVTTSPIYSGQANNQCAPSGRTIRVPTGGKPPSQPEPEYLCACIKQPPSCNALNPLESGGTPTVVVAGGDDCVTIRLCNGGLVQQGPHSVPETCPQSCDQGPAAPQCDVIAASASTCDTGLECDGHLCQPVPRKVHIVSTSLNIQTYDNDFGVDPIRNEFSAPADMPIVELDCDPRINASVNYDACVDDDETADVRFNFQCTQGTDGSFTVNATAKLLSGCGSGANDENDTLSFTVGVPPFSPGNPTPTIDYADPSNQAASCFGQPGTCDENGAHFSFEFSNVPE